MCSLHTVEGHLQGHLVLNQPTSNPLVDCPIVLVATLQNLLCTTSWDPCSSHDQRVKLSKFPPPKTVVIIYNYVAWSNPCWRVQKGSWWWLCLHSKHDLLLEPAIKPLLVRLKLSKITWMENQRTFNPPIKFDRKCTCIFIYIYIYI